MILWCNCVQGFQYQLGDFQVRVGKVLPAHTDNLRGIVMEVMYSIHKLYLLHLSAYCVLEPLYVFLIFIFLPQKIRRIICQKLSYICVKHLQYPQGGCTQIQFALKTEKYSDGLLYQFWLIYESWFLIDYTRHALQRTPAGCPDLYLNLPITNFPCRIPTGC